MKKQKYFVLIIVFFAFSLFCSAEKIGDFNDDYIKMPSILVDDAKVYIIDEQLQKGYIYDLKSFKKIATFCGFGHGPGEFTGIFSTGLQGDCIHISGPNKIAFFSKDGKLIRETRTPSWHFNCLPLGNDGYMVKYVKPIPKPGQLLTDAKFSIYDRDMKLMNDFYSTKSHPKSIYIDGVGNLFAFTDFLHASVYNNNIYVGDTRKGFYFIVFNRDGKKLYEIKKDIKPRMLTGEQKEKIRKKYSRHGLLKNRKTGAKIKLVIYDTLPAYQAFFVADDRIYVFPYPEKNMYNIHILDLQGKLLKKKQVSASTVSNVDSRYDYIYKGKLYYIGLKMLDDDYEMFLERIDIW